MNSYTFKLDRRRWNHKQNSTEIISTFNIQLESTDPLLTRLQLANQYPGWAIQTIGFTLGNR